MGSDLDGSGYTADFHLVDGQWQSVQIRDRAQYPQCSVDRDKYVLSRRGDGRHWQPGATSLAVVYRCGSVDVIHHNLERLPL